MSLALGGKAPQGLSSHVAIAIAAGALSLVVHLFILILVGEIRIAAVTPVGSETSDDSRVSTIVEKVKMLKERWAKRDEADDERLASDVARELGLTTADRDRSMDAVTPALIEPDGTDDIAMPDVSPDLSPAPAEAIEPWQPRRKIIAVERPRVDDRLSTLPRDVIPSVERVRDTPDYIPPYTLPKIAMGTTDSAMMGDSTVESPALIGPTENGVALPDSGQTGPAGSSGQTETLFVDPLADVANSRPLESLLKANLTAVTFPSDDDFTYFEIVIDRLSGEKLPTIPKDLMVVVDCSKSMSAVRLALCKKAIRAFLGQLKSVDRFNIVGFDEVTRECFKGWQRVTDKNLALAQAFVSDMQASGETDIYGAMSALSKTGREKGRPVVILLLTDGRPTIGMTESSRIIGDFTSWNEGEISVFALGVSDRANWYLLDQISYGNRGQAAAVKGGRWGIPDAFQQLAHSVADPVMTDVRFLFDQASQCEIYPLQTMNLYAGRPLVLYGRCRRDVASVTFQARGEAGEVACDMIFTLSVNPGPARRAEHIRSEWAVQKVFSLIGLQAKDFSESRRSEIRRTVRRYGVAIPYAEAW